MVPIEKVKDIIIQYNSLEKELSSGNVDPKLFAKKSKEYARLGNIISTARHFSNFDNEKKDLENMLEDKTNDQEMMDLGMVGLGAELGDMGDIDIVEVFSSLEKAEKRLAWMTITKTMAGDMSDPEKQKLITDIAELVGIKIN